MSIFLASALAILLVVFAAPASHRRKLAVWTAVVMVVLSITAVLLMDEPLSGAFIAAVGIAGFTLWLTRKPAEGKGARQRLLAGAFLATFAALLAASYFDWPGQPDVLPRYLVEVRDGKRGAIDRFYNYPLGGFIDSESLWRIDAAPEVLEAVASKLGMRNCDAAPAQFWRMPPYYWPRSLPTGARLYATPLFPAVTRGGDGDHYFMLVDGKRSRGLVWIKNNF